MELVGNVANLDHLHVQHMLACAKHVCLQTFRDLTSERTIPGDGVLQGTYAQNDGHGSTETYRWRLVPER
jgi:hypothetical protein